MSDVIKNVFVSHHHKDDASVDGLTSMVAGKGYRFRNSSIRVKPENQKRLDQNKVSEITIKRLLKMKINWASQVIVVIGKRTHSRPWVDWEIETAKKLGKPIIGVFENGLKGNVNIPKGLEDYASSIVGWRADSVIGALNGNGEFQNQDGSTAPKHDGIYSVC